MKDYLKRLKNEFNQNTDLIIKKIKLPFFKFLHVIFLESLVSSDKVNDYILKRKKNIITNLGSNLIKLNNYDEIEYYLYNGFIIVLQGKNIYAIEAKADITRSVSTNEVEPAIKGPKNAFIENIQVNTGLIKRRIKSHNLKNIDLVLGRLSSTKVSLFYIEGIVNETLVDDVYSKIKNLDIDIVNDSENLIEYLGQNSMFPTVISTERPDRCAKALSEGKVVLLCDESPNALILPAFLVDFINPFTDNYAENKNINFTKIIRFMCFVLSAIIPAFYIGVINYNQEAIPTSLAISFAMQRSGVPFPAIIECLIMLIICEILRESDLRFPNKYGSAISILGALVLGDAAVSAGLVSPIMIIISALTYISSLIFSELEIDNALRYFRFFLLFIAAFYGIYGLFLGILYMVIKLCSIKSYDIPYTFPLSPFDKVYFKEYFLKKKNYLRSKYLSKNRVKEKP